MSTRQTAQRDIVRNEGLATLAQTSMQELTHLIYTPTTAGTEAT
jgi:hypothetical protein